jgi:hypothetical protein
MISFRVTANVNESGRTKSLFKEYILRFVAICSIRKYVTQVRANARAYFLRYYLISRLRYPEVKFDLQKTP